MEFLTAHPHDVCMTYLDHFGFSARLSGIFLTASLQALVHAVLPCFFTKSSTEHAKTIARLIEQSGCHE